MLETPEAAAERRCPWADPAHPVPPPPRLSPVPAKAAGTPRRCRRLPRGLSAAMAEELSDLLREFEEVMEDFERGPACQYEQHLQELKRRAGHSVYDSGIEELESTSMSPGSSLSSSEEDLNTSASTYPSKAKLGDTQELEEFIADLDKVLEEM
ncbi:regulator of cell cycle RGCC isoform X1 [Colius striatus]|uniref:regulator of cell cycle RGCC isoform X1 n=2 Tax=Colius striatus TaxID=57412 RepID=UPI002B1E47BC|nr:regulator of cell cycle RGCC isoform X1 [Colius striatus]